jgi:hypothetical protein
MDAEDDLNDVEDCSDIVVDDRKDTDEDRRGLFGIGPFGPMVS